jgi:uncharacterized membrane protein
MVASTTVKGVAAMRVAAAAAHRKNMQNRFMADEL